MTNDNNENRKLIEDEYTQLHATAVQLLDEIGAQLWDLPAPGEDVHWLNWGHVGSLRMICDRLTEIQQHLGQTKLPSETAR